MRTTLLILLLALAGAGCRTIQVQEFQTSPVEYEQ